jgi:hypothetical protein
MKSCTLAARPAPLSTRISNPVSYLGDMTLNSLQGSICSESHKNRNHNHNMYNKNLSKPTTKISTQFLNACPALAAITAGLLLVSATANAGVIFQADFNGPGGGTGGTNNLVTLGGTGTIQADGINTISFVTNANPFMPGGGNYLQVQKLSSGGPYAPVLFTFASDTNSWPAWQGADILDTNGNYDLALNGAYDVFFRVNSSNSTNDMSSFRTVQQYSWSDGGKGLSMVLNGQTGGYMIFQLKNTGFNLGVTPQAITNFTSSGGNIAYYPQWDEIDAYFNPSIPLTNGLPYHIAYSFKTDTNGLTTLGLYLKQGTGAIDSTLDQVGWATFSIIATNLSDQNGNLTDVCFTNQPWNFGAEWASDGPFVTDYAQTRLYDSVPATFTALPGSPTPPAPPQPGVIFEADFKGPGGGTGGSNDMVTFGGTGAIVADGVNVVSFITNANPFTPDGGNYLEVQRLTASGGGGYVPVLFTFASDTNSWMGWQGADILGSNGNYDIVLHAAYDVFFRVNSSNTTNDMSSFRPLQLDSGNGWSDGGNGLKLILNGQNGGWLQLQIANKGFILGTTPAAIVNFTSSSGAASYDANWDTINMGFNTSAPLANGQVYHLAFSLATDTNNGLTTAKLYLRQGAGAVDPTLDLMRSASFNLLSSNLLNWSQLPTGQAFTNVPWSFGVGWAADGPFVTDYASTRLYNSVPATFTALPSGPLKFLSAVVSSGQITLSWTGSGQLQWAPTIQGPWTSITPAPASPYSEALVPGNRFYRLLAQ